MAYSAEAIVERRRLTRRVVVWRSVAALAAALAVVAFAGFAGFGGGLSVGGARIAKLDIVGVIVSDDDRRDALKAAAEDDDVKALIISIDSPGGTFVGSDDLHRQIRAVAAEILAALAFLTLSLRAVRKPVSV